MSKISLISSGLPLNKIKTLLKDFKVHLEKRGYKQSEIEPIIQETISANRKDLLRKPKKKNNNKAVPTVLVTKFNPCRNTGITYNTTRYEMIYSQRLL